MIKTGDFSEKEVTLKWDTEPKTVFTIRELNYAALEAIEKAAGVPPQSAFASAPTKKKKDKKTGKTIEVYDMEKIPDDQIYKMTTFTNRRDLEIVRQGLVAIDGTPMDPDSILNWLQSINPAKYAGKVISDLSSLIGNNGEEVEEGEEEDGSPKD